VAASPTGCRGVAADGSITPLHIAAITQIRHRHSVWPRFYDRKIAEGHTPREAIRSLKRRLSDIVWRHLIANV